MSSTSEPGARWSTPGDPTWAWLLRGATASSVVPLWVAKHLPMADLPEHLATISILRHWWDPAFGAGSYYRLLPPSQMEYVLYHFVGALLAFALGPVHANALILSLAAVGLPYGMRAILRAIGHDERLALFGCALVWNFAFVTGLCNYACALPVLLFAIARTIRQALAPTTRGAITLFGYGVVLFYLHISALLVLCFAAPLILWLLPAPAPTSMGRELLMRLVRLPKRLAWLGPALGIMALWSCAGPTGRMPTTAIYRSLWEALQSLPEGLLDVWKGSKDEQYAIAIVVVAFAIACPQPRPREERGTTWARGVLLLVGLVTVALYFGLPNQVGVCAFVAQRYAIVAALILALCLRPAPGLRGAVPLACVGAIAIWAAVVNIGQIRAFEREVGRFDELLAKTEPKRRLLTLMFDADSKTARFPAFIHFGAYYRMRYGGVAAMSFIEMPHWPIQYRAESAPPTEPTKWEWDPCGFRNAREGTYYDYVLTRGALEPFASRPPGPLWALVGHEGKFSLYRKVPGEVASRGDAADEGPCATGSLENQLATLNPFVDVDGFALQVHEVSRREYRIHIERLAPGARARAKPLDEAELADDAHDTYPIASLTHEQADRYCRSVSARLPTTAERSLAGRGVGFRCARELNAGPSRAAAPQTN